MIGVLDFNVKLLLVNLLAFEFYGGILIRDCFSVIFKVF